MDAIQAGRRVRALPILSLHGSKEYVRKSHAIAAAKQHTAKQLHNQKVKEEYENRLAEEKQVLYQSRSSPAQRP